MLLLAEYASFAEKTSSAASNAAIAARRVMLFQVSVSESEPARISAINLRVLVRLCVAAHALQLCCSANHCIDSVWDDPSCQNLGFSSRGKLQAIVKLRYPAAWQRGLFQQSIDRLLHRSSLAVLAECRSGYGSRLEI